MRKRITSILLMLTFCILQILPVYAQENPINVIDEAGLLEVSQAEELNAKLEQISEEQGCDVVIVTVNDLEGKTATAYADDYFDYNGYGQGSDASGILFLIDMGDRKWAISTCGYGITAFTDAGQEYIIDQIKSDLSDGNYYECFSEYAKLCEEFLTQAHKDRPYDVTNLPDTNDPSQPVRAVAALGLAVLISFFVMAHKKAEMKSVRMNQSAVNYVTDYQLTRHNDFFLYRKVDRRAKPKDKGSSTHSSSSGRSHGGSSGSF